MAQIKHTDIHIIAPVGLAGSGKSTAVEYFTAQGIPKIYGGGIMYSMMTEAGIDITWESQKQFREEMRTREGQDFILKRAIKDIHQLIKAGQKKIVLDGLYTWSEYKTLLHEFPGQVTVIAIVAPKQLRYQRLQNRLERPMQPHEIKERDWSEIENMEKGGPIAMADYFVINDGSLDKLHDQLHIAANDVHFCKAPAQC
jgi:dephospho-CoA kinase